jgi:hypothetical protein
MAMNEQSRRDHRKHGDNPWTRLVWGLSLLSVGIITWLDHLGRVNASDYLRWWPLALIALGLAHFPRGQWFGGLVAILLGILFLPSVPFLPFLRLSNVLALWPLLIAAGGVTLLVQAVRPVPKDLRRTDAFHAFAMMGGTSRAVASTGLLGGDAVAVMGGCEINLSSAQIASEAIIDVLAFWGGIEIHVPRGWQIENRVVAILAGMTDRTDHDVPADAPRLIIRGSAIMGGIEVRHPKEPAWQPAAR